MSEKTKHSEPLLRISKRDGLIWWKSWLVPRGGRLRWRLYCVPLL